MLMRIEMKILSWTGPTCEAALALLLAAGDGEELVGEQVEGGGAAVRVGLKAAQDEGFGLQRHGLWDLRVDLKHAHLQRKDTEKEPWIEIYRKTKTPKKKKKRSNKEHTLHLSG